VKTLRPAVKQALAEPGAMAAGPYGFVRTGNARGHSRSLERFAEQPED
jgi:hypothetical protein